MLSSESPTTWQEGRDPGAGHERDRWPRITVVTPSFEQGRFLEATIKSVLEQGYPNLEYIVVDGGSSDDSVSLLRRYQQELTCWISEPDRGQAHAINKGLARSTGDILGWLNSDDLLLPGSLHRIARTFRRNASTAVVAGLRRRIDSDGRVIGNWFRDLPTKQHLRHYCCLAQETVYWSRAVWKKVGELDESLHYALDYEFWLRILHNGFGFTWIPRYQGAFRQHAASKTTLSEEVYHHDIREIYERYGLGRNEEEVLAGMGEYWPQRLALLEDLGQSTWSRSPGLVSFLLRRLDEPRTHSAMTTFYRHYRSLRPRGQARPPKMSALARAGYRTVIARPVGDRQEPFLLRSDPLNRPRICDGEWRQDPSGLGPEDTLRVGAGWSWVEHSPDHVYRWAENDAEIVVLRPSGRRSELLIDLEAGPALDWRSFDLTVLDEQDNVLLRKPVKERETLALTVPLEAGPDARFFRLRAAGRGGPASATDSRILRFRATRIRWKDEDVRFDLPMAPGQVAEIVLEASDIVPSGTVESLMNASDIEAMPTPGLFLARAWSRQDNETGCRNALPGAELVVSKAAGRELAIRFRGAAPRGPCSLESDRRDPIKGRSSKSHQVILFALPEILPTLHVLRLVLPPESDISPPIQSLRWVQIG